MAYLCLKICLRMMKKNHEVWSHREEGLDTSQLEKGFSMSEHLPSMLVRVHENPFIQLFSRYQSPTCKSAKRAEKVQGLECFCPFFFSTVALNSLLSIREQN